MILKLALRSLIFEKILNICLIAALCSIIAPLLLLFSLRFGIVSTLEDNLKSDPKNLEIMMMQGYSLNQEFFDKLEKDPSIAFYIPLTRSLSVTANLFASGKKVEYIDTTPTKKGDPIALKSNLSGDLNFDEAYLSESLAYDLNLKVGDKFRFIVSRIKDGKNVNAILNLTLKGLLKKEYVTYKTIFVNFDLLVAMEDYKDGYDPLILSDGSNLNTQRQFFSKARIYVKSLDDVEIVSQKLRKDYQILDKTGEIAQYKAISKVLSLVFYSICATSIVGGLLAIFGLILTNLSRLEKSYALLFVSGLSKIQVSLCVFLLHFLISTLAFIFASIVFYIGMLIFNYEFAGILGQSNTIISLLEFKHLAFAYGACVLGTTLISLIICKFRILNMNVADTLRAL